MFNPKKTIPQLAGATLALAGCPADGGSGGAALTDALTAWCMKHADCFPNSPYYQPTDYCISYQLSYYGLEGDISAECEAAAIGYFDCALDLECFLLLLDKNACDIEWDDDADANCPDWPD